MSNTAVNRDFTLRLRNLSNNQVACGEESSLLVLIVIARYFFLRNLYSGNITQAEKLCDICDWFGQKTTTPS